MAQDGGTPTLARVAASAGVSVATVSKVLNGRADVGAETRARVESLLAAHDYVARRAEVTEAAERQQTVELVFHGPLTAYTTGILEGVLDAGAERGVSVSVSVRPRRQPSPGALRPAAWARRAGRQGPARGDRRRRRRPARRPARARPRAACRSWSSTRSARRARSWPASARRTSPAGWRRRSTCSSLGHRRVAYLGCDPTSAYNQARVHGFRAACEAAGVVVPDAYVRIGSVRLRGRGGRGDRAARPGPSRRPRIFAATDEIAAGVLEAARRRGLRVPSDLSVVGFDDTAVAEILSPPLTTVRQPLREMGRVALSTALRIAAREQLESHHVELATELVVRSSTAPPPR